MPLPPPRPPRTRRLKQLALRGISAKVLSVGYPLAPEHPFPAGR